MINSVKLYKCNWPLEMINSLFAGKCWMDALELALKCTSLLKRSMTRLDTSTEVPDMDTELTRKQVLFFLF